MTEKLKNAHLGRGECSYCGHAVEVKTTKNGLIYYHCPKVEDGGCQTQVFTRSRKAGDLIARKITKWQPGMQAAWGLGGSEPPPRSAPNEKHKRTQQQRPAARQKPAGPPNPAKP